MNNKKIIIIRIIMNIIGGILLSFGLYNIHNLSHVTEGGILGLTLFFDHWVNISPAITGFILNTICYIIGWRILGKSFIGYSFFAAGSFSVSYAIFEMFPPIYPEIANMPIVATVVGAIFVGVSVGICVKFGGAPTGDDAIAMALSNKLKIDIRWVYMISDLTVLAISLSYIDIKRIGLSLITVILSGQIIGIIQNIGRRKNKIIKGIE